ncbi:MAG: branched-chain amino acid ABC transporter substrate-binding protein, partial [Spirochaetes bacterium]
YAVNMLVEEVNGAGGLKVGDQTYSIRVVTEDNESKAESAVSAATKLITEDQVLAIIGSYASKQAIPTGEVANARKTPNISPWSTNPRTTLNRPWVFRACFIDPYQAKVAASFAQEEFGVSKVAVLYDVASDYPKGLAENFRDAAIDLGMEVVAFETFTTKDRDFSSQLTKIINSGAELLFSPQYYDEVPLIVSQAKQLGWDKPILGSDSWSSPELVKLAGEDVIGYYFTSHYAMKGATGKTKEFIDKYKAKYGYEPGDVAALAWDATNILFEAIKNTGGLSGDLQADRKAIRDQLAKVERWEGTTGLMSFTEEGDPIKAVVIVRIDEEGEFSFYKMAIPPELK